MFEDRSKEFDRALLMLDITSILIAFFASYGFRFGFSGYDRGNFYEHISILPMIFALILFHLSYFNAYVSPRRMRMVDYVWAVSKSVAAAMTAILGVIFFLKLNFVSRVVIINFTGLILAMLILDRVFIVSYFRRSLNRGEYFLKVLIIGTGNRAIHLSRVLREKVEWGVDIVGYIDPKLDLVGSEVLGVPVLGTVEDISSILKQYVIDEVLLAIPRTLIGDVESIAHACEEEGIKLRIMADLYDLEVARVSLMQLDAIPLLTLEPVALDEGKLFLKRLIDVAAVTLSMPVLLPLMGCVALAIKFDSPGPVFFLQDRVGLKKRQFKMIKFRSMYVGSEGKLKELEHLNEAQGPIFKMTNDPRVTRVGRFIRRTSLDEIPQLLNVLGGSMSLVGPRPMSVRDVNLFDRGIQRKRFSVKPGITCLWQISGRSNLPFSKWLEFDLEYIEKWSLTLDFKILLKTVPVVLRGNGAV
ncbi:sugar transferase [Desulfococcus sp.]|uniref:sugar transferase n=1 Tax=Desulfococcus sp. TaxID=2025834 RepID=UPI0035945E56